MVGERRIDEVDEVDEVTCQPGTKSCNRAYFLHRRVVLCEGDVNSLNPEEVHRVSNIYINYIVSGSRDKDHTTTQSRVPAAATLSVPRPCCCN